MMNIGVEIVFKYNSIDPSEVWKILVQSHPDFLSGEKTGTISHEKHKLSQAIKIIKQQEIPYFLIEINDSKFHFSPLGNYNISFLAIDLCVNKLEDITTWVVPFIKYHSFIQARGYNIDYEYWQNASDPLQYNSVDKPYNHLPMKSNGLPFPLEQTIIDTSTNPGLRILRSGFIEAIGSMMWFGEHFWEVVRVKKEDVCKKNWITCLSISDHVVFIKLSEVPFENDHGESLITQNKLRTLLFPDSQCTLNAVDATLSLS